MFSLLIAFNGVCVVWTGPAVSQSATFTVRPFFCLVKWRADHYRCAQRGFWVLHLPGHQCGRQHLDQSPAGGGKQWVNTSNYLWTHTPTHAYTCPFIHPHQLHQTPAVGLRWYFNINLTTLKVQNCTCNWIACVRPYHKDLSNIFVCVWTNCFFAPPYPFCSKPK